MRFHPEDDPELPFLPTEPAASARPRLPKLRGRTLEAIALWTMACAERADREALPGDAERMQFKRGEASAYRTVARRLLRLLTEAPPPSAARVRVADRRAAAPVVRVAGRRARLAEHILDAVRTENHASINSIVMALRRAGRGARKADVYVEVEAMLADGRLVKVDDLIRPAAGSDA